MREGERMDSVGGWHARSRARELDVALLTCARMVKRNLSRSFWCVSDAMRVAGESLLFGPGGMTDVFRFRLARCEIRRRECSEVFGAVE
eukprot:6176002-Pleurochrysis_carterae.AAC.3